MFNEHDAIRKNTTAQYEITLYAENGEQLSLQDTPPSGVDRTPADTLWEAAAKIATIPHLGWMHWDDPQESEQLPIKRIVLEHSRTGKNVRGIRFHETALLEVIER